MKEWFTYQNGYVNVDNDWIYLTSTGNWSETLKLKERSRAKKSSQNARGKRIKIGFTIVSAIIIAFTLAALVDDSFVVPMLGLGTVVSLWIYMQREMGPTFKINQNRIIKIEFDGDYITLQFTNDVGEQHETTLDLVEQKGCLILAKLGAMKQIEMEKK